jgi:hypothetical protein
MARPLILDGCNMFSRAMITANAFEYVDIGSALPANKHVSDPKNVWLDNEELR